MATSGGSPFKRFKTKRWTPSGSGQYDHYWIVLFGGGVIVTIILGLIKVFGG